MPISQNQRLRKAAEKAAKRKAAVAEKLAEQRRELAISKPRHIHLAASPIVSCTLSEGYETRGMGMLTVARKLSLGRYGLCEFLLDAWCLGVKDAFFRVIHADDYEALLEDLEMAGAPTPIAPSRARKLLRDAAAYGASNGFPPLDDLAEMERILGDVEPDAESSYVFGHNGRPHFVAAPDESIRRLRFIRETLEAKFGRQGYDFTFEEELEDDGVYDYVDENGEIIERSAISDEEFDAAALEIENDPQLLAEIEDAPGLLAEPVAEEELKSSPKL